MGQHLVENMMKGTIQKDGKEVRTPTTTVMFVPTTKRGLLTAKLKEQENKLVGITGFRMKYQESGGVQLGKLFSTDLARDLPCGRDQCWPCQTSKEGQQKKCKARSVLYETSCCICNPDVEMKQPSIREEEDDNDPKVGKHDVADPSPSPMGRVGIYLGETSRSLHERAKEHVNDAKTVHAKSHIVKHWLESHPDLNDPPTFRFQVKRCFKDCLTRQLSEAISINRSKDMLLNSKNEYVTNCISRITVQEGAVEKKLRERKEEESEKAEELKLLKFKEEKIRARIQKPGRRGELAEERRARTTSGTVHHTPQVEKESVPEGRKAAKRMEKLRKKMRTEKAEVLRKMAATANLNTCKSPPSVWLKGQVCTPTI